MTIHRKPGGGSKPSAPRFAEGERVVSFNVVSVIGRKPSGPTALDSVWWYKVRCRRCGGTQEASQVSLRYLSQGRAMRCKACYQRKADKAMEAPTVAIEPTPKKMALPDDVPAPLRAVAKRYPSGWASRTWAAAMEACRCHR